MAAASVIQPTVHTNVSAIRDVVVGDDIQQMDAAVAYATSSGVAQLMKGDCGAFLRDAGGASKRWLTCFDYLRSEPIALDYLASLPNSSVRIFEANYSLLHKGTPRIPFHPKAFLFQGAAHHYALVGSGNLSRSGLLKGHEAGVLITNEPADHGGPVSAFYAWYEEMWAGSSPLSTELLAAYRALYDSQANRTAPTPTEDDLSDEAEVPGALSSTDLMRLRVCQNLWIEGGNITKNRGPNLPGNQLMMKRLSRVFFGYSAESLPPNTTLGAVNIYWNGHDAVPCTLSYSDNKMDKLNLPVPGAGGPAKYDNECLLFSRVSPHEFELAIGSNAERKAWKKRSKAIDGAFAMSGGRQWGVF
jgi:hypothetical protein